MPQSPETVARRRQASIAWWKTVSHEEMSKKIKAGIEKHRSTRCRPYQLTRRKER